MHRIDRILVPVKELREPLPLSARRAAEIAKRSHAALELMHVLYQSGVYDSRMALHDLTDRTIELLMADAQRELDRHVHAVAKLAVPVRPRVVWDHPAHDAIVRRGRQGFDLIVIGTRARRRLARMLVDYNDRALIRDCAQPLLIAKSRRSYARIRVLAAVDPLHAHARSGALDARIVEWAQTLARLFGGHVDLVHAVSVHPVQVRRALRPYVVRSDLKVIERARERARKSVHELARKHRVSESHVHVLDGHPVDVIARTARRLEAQVVVMGVVARGTVERLRFGSTVETLLDDLQCDILAIKPRGFRSPVPARTEVG